MSLFCLFYILILLHFFIFFYSSFTYPSGSTGKLYFLASDEVSRPHFQNPQKCMYMCTDTTLIYTAFFADFGPLDLGLTYTFCQVRYRFIIVLYFILRLYCFLYFIVFLFFAFFHFFIFIFWAGGIFPLFLLLFLY